MRSARRRRVFDSGLGMQLLVAEGERLAIVPLAGGRSAAGIIEVVAELFTAGILRPDGRFTNQGSGVRGQGSGAALEAQTLIPDPRPPIPGPRPLA